MKILVVEDEAPIRDLISINLQLVGYEVFSAEDGIIAQEFFRKTKGRFNFIRCYDTGDRWILVD